MIILKSYYCSIYDFSYKLLLLIVVCFLSACSGQNNAKQVLPFQNQILASKSAININTASTAELEKLPQIGSKTAQTIVEHREKFGKFRKSEYLLLVRGISDKHFREMRSFVKVE